jgi:hypothetical protein
MREGHHGVKLDWEPPVWCGDKYPLTRYPPGLSKEAGLLVWVADMFQNRGRVDVVEFLVRKRKTSAIGKHKPQSGINVFKKLCVIHAGCGNPILVGIPLFQVIGMAIAPVTRDSNVEDSILLLYPGRR